MVATERPIVGGIACKRCRRPFIPADNKHGGLTRLCNRKDCRAPRPVRQCAACNQPFVPKRKEAKLCVPCVSSRGRGTYEAAQQKAFVAHIRKRGDMPVAANNGAHLAGGFKGWSHLQAMGGAKGFPDVAVHGPVGKPSLFVEMKSPGETMSAEQEDWRDHLLELGHAHFVAYSAIEAIEAYEAWRESLRGA